MQIATRPNRFLSVVANTISTKVPRNLAADELNVVLGLGSATVAGAAGPYSLAAVVPRDCFLRDLMIVGPTGSTITSITVNGDALVLGGAVPIEAFAASNLNRPEFDLPAGRGTTVTVAGTGAIGTFYGAFNID